MLAFEYVAYRVTTRVNVSVTVRIESSSLRSDILGSIGFRMFSVNVTEGASRVAEAQLLMADSRAPKNITWANSGAFSSTSRGRISCGSRSINSDTIFGSSRV